MTLNTNFITLIFICAYNPSHSSTSLLRQKQLFIRSSPPKPPILPIRPQNSGALQCGESLIELVPGSRGFIESPGYPYKYQGGLDCEWKLSGVPGTQIQATIFDLQTQESPDVSDFVYLSLSGNWSETLRFAGDLNYATPLILVTEGSTMFLRFKTSRFSDGSQGFRIAYFVSEKSTVITDSTDDDLVAAVCKYNVGENGVLLNEENNLISRVNRRNPHPYLVAMVLDDMQFCSGTLISDRHVLASAHCTKGVNKVRMVFGTDDLSVSDVGAQERYANRSAISEHPNFDPFTGANDLSIIELEDAITITKQVVPVALLSWSYISSAFGDVIGQIVGWGESKNGDIQEKASLKNIRISVNAFCKVSNKASNGLSMCSKGILNSTCQSDAGSPLVTNHAYCNGPVQPPVMAVNDSPLKPQKPGVSSKPSKPVKPSKPGKPQKSYSKQTTTEFEKYPVNVLLGIVSYGTCDKGFSFTRITAYLDFISDKLGPLW